MSLDFVELFAERTVWKISPWYKGKGWPEFKEGEFIGLGDPPPYDQLTDLSLYGSKEEFPDEMGSGRKRYYWAFAHEMKKGDIVIATSAGKIFGIGEVVSGYSYSSDSEYPHIRHVRWFHIPEISNEGGLVCSAVYRRVTTLIRIKKTPELLECGQRLNMFLDDPERQPGFNPRECFEDGSFGNPDPDVGYGAYEECELCPVRIRCKETAETKRRDTWDEEDLDLEDDDVEWEEREELDIEDLIALPGIGPKMAEALVDAGYETLYEIAEAKNQELIDLEIPRLSTYVAQNIINSAKTLLKQRKVVYFDRTPFSVMLLSALETYPTECTGLLFGYENPDPAKATFEVWSAIPYQLVYHRSEDTVVEELKSYLRLISTQEKITGDVVLGGFHSHPDAGPLISDEDIEYLVKKKTHRIEVIIGIMPIGEQREWEVSEDEKTIFGHVVLGDSVYGVEIAACYLADDEVRRLCIRPAYVELMIDLQNHGIYIHTLGDLIQRAKNLGKNYYTIRDLLNELEQHLDADDEIKEMIIQQIKEELEY